MNIALFGYGKMGKEIEAFATESGHQISARVDSSNSKESFDYSNIDVIIEFSKPEFAAENIRFAIDHAIPIAIGTTGWYDQLEDLTTYCNANKGCMLHATNFSLGVNAFFAVNRYLAKIMNELNDYKAEVVEIHHTEKLVDHLVKLSQSSGIDPDLRVEILELASVNRPKRKRLARLLEEAKCDLPTE